MISKLLFRDYEMAVMQVLETIRCSYNTSVYAGRYLRTKKGYWYRIELDGGILRRMKYVKQIKVLEDLYLGVGKSG